MMRPATLLTCLFLCLVAAGHLLRIAMGIDVIVDDIVIPMWPSILAVVVTIGLAIGLWRDALTAPRAVM
jgi:hypothetical protein